MSNTNESATVDLSKFSELNKARRKITPSPATSPQRRRRRRWRSSRRSQPLARASWMPCRSSWSSSSPPTSWLSCASHSLFFFFFVPPRLHGTRFDDLIPLRSGLLTALPSGCRCSGCTSWPPRSNHPGGRRSDGADPRDRSVSSSIGEIRSWNWQPKIIRLW